MKRKSISLFISLIILISGCSIKYAPQPELNRDAELQNRIQQYSNYMIIYTTDFFSGPTFTQNFIKYNKKGIKGNIQLSESAYSEFSSAELMETIGSIFGGAGGACSGYYLGNSLAGGDPSSVLIIAGLAGMTVNIILSIIAKDKYRKSASLYNNYLMNELNLDESNVTFRERKTEYFAGSFDLLSIKF